MLNYFYDKDAGLYELYYGDTLIIELPYANLMTDQQAADLANTLFLEYINEHKANNAERNV